MDTDAIGTTLNDRFRLEAVLGQGGLGTVFAARDLALSRVVAVKMIRRELSSRPDLVTQFIREATILSQLASNPHVLTIYDLCYLADGTPFIVAERLQGRSLRSAISNTHLPSRTSVMEVAIQVALALFDVHSLGITHCDIKPANIFIVETAAIPLLVKIIDFGSSHSSEHVVGVDPNARRIAGTVAYMAPEVLCGTVPTPAADIFSFGVTLLEFACAKHPFPDAQGHKKVGEHAEAPSIEPSLNSEGFPDDFCQLVAEMLSAVPQRRPVTEACLQRLRQSYNDYETAKEKHHS